MYLIDNGNYWTDGKRLMSSMRLNLLREEYPGYTDWEIFDQHSIKRYIV